MRRNAPFSRAERSGGRWIPRPDETVTKTSTFVAGLSLRSMITPFVLDGPINRLAFETYVEKVLVPEPRTGDIVIMDNISSHKGARVRARIRARIEAASAELLFLPPYSPDLNPIEILVMWRAALSASEPGRVGAFGQSLVGRCP